VIPLAIYLLSFILVFAKWPPLVHKIMVVVMPLAILVPLFMMQPHMKKRVVMTIALQLLSCFVTALVCHVQIARTRPATRYLTGLYLLMSLGGVLGGLFNAVVAPLLFYGVAEYQIAIVCACLLLPTLEEETTVWLSRRFFPRWPLTVGTAVDVVLA